MKGILGRKLGMTEVFGISGKLTPVTVIEIEPNVITQVKTVETDGYNAIQIAFDTVKEKNSNKAKMGITKKANTAPKRFLREIRNVEIENYKVGDELKADVFTVGEMVDVTGTTKGKGFQGVIKRHNQSRGPMSHGSHYHRGPGSMGTMRPMRVLPGKKLPGQMGGVQATIQNLEIVAVDLENNVILVKGNVPGAKKSLVMIRTAVKNPEVIKEREELISYVEIEETPEVNEEVIEQVEETNEEVVEETTEEVVEEAKEETPEEVKEAE